jgi:hypothetical protein
MKLTKGNKAKIQNNFVDIALKVAPFVLGAIAVNQIGIKLGLWDSAKDKKLAKAFRDSPYVKTTYVLDNIPPLGQAKPLQDIVKYLFDNDDIWRLNKVTKSVKDLYYAKGYLYDDEDSAIRNIKDNVKSLIDLSIYSGLMSNYIQQPFIDYLDSFLENSYQAELWKYLRDLPVLTIKEKSILEKRTGKKVTFSTDNKIIYK